MMPIDRSRLPWGAAFFGAPLLAWTLYWWTAIGMAVLTTTHLGRGGLGAGLAAHDVFEVLFVAGHGGLIWTAGAAALGLAWRVSWLRHRRSEARAADPHAVPRPHAAGD